MIFCLTTVTTNSFQDAIINDLQERVSKHSEIEAELSRLSESSRVLMETAKGDKEAISRALVQNKELKVQIAELQDQFVKISNSNMELQSELQTAKHSNGK